MIYEYFNMNNFFYKIWTPYLWNVCLVIKEWFFDCFTIKDYLWIMYFIKLSSILFMHDLKKYDLIKYDLRMSILRNMKKSSQIAIYDSTNG